MACDIKVLDGAILRMYLDGVVVAKDTSSELSIEHSTRETTVKLSGEWKSFTKGIKGFSISGEALYVSDTYSETGKKPSDVYAYLVSGEEVTFKLITPDMLDGYWTGKCIINSMSVSSGNSGENVTYSYGAQGTGELEFKTTA